MQITQRQYCSKGIFHKMLWCSAQSGSGLGSVHKAHSTNISGTACPGGHKEMSSFLADRWRPRIWAQMRGGGGCEASANEYSCAHGAQINFGDLRVTPYLTYGLVQHSSRVTNHSSYGINYKGIIARKSYISYLRIHYTQTVIKDKIQFNTKYTVQY